MEIRAYLLLKATHSQICSDSFLAIELINYSLNPEGSYLSAWGPGVCVLIPDLGLLPGNPEVILPTSNHLHFQKYCVLLGPSQLFE